MTYPKLVIYVFLCSAFLSIIYCPSACAINWTPVPNKDSHITSGVIGGSNYSDFGCLWVVADTSVSPTKYYAWGGLWGENVPSINGISQENSYASEYYHNYTTGEDVLFRQSMTGSPGGWVFDPDTVSVPIFDSRSLTLNEDISNYIFNGDVSGAINSEDFLPDSSFSSEIPSILSISLSDKSLQQNQNTFINDFVFTVKSDDLSNFTGFFDCSGFVRLNMVKVNKLLGEENYTLIDGNEHQTRATVSFDSRYSNNEVTISISALEMNNLINTVLSEDGENNINAIGKTLYINDVFITCRNEYVEGDEFVVGSWGESYNFSYNYITKQASAYVSDVPSDSSTGISVPNVTPNSSTPNGYNNSNNSLNFPDRIIYEDRSHWNLYDSLQNALSGMGVLKENLSSAFGLFSDIGNNGLIGILATIMPWMPQQYWALITLAVTSGISLSVVGAIFSFLRR